MQWGGSVEKRQQQDKGHSWTVPLPLVGLFDCEGRTTPLAPRVLLHVARTECGCEEGVGVGVWGGGGGEGINHLILAFT